MKEQYTAKVDDNFEFQLDAQKKVDFIPLGNDNFHVLHNGKAFQAKVLEMNAESKSFLIEINGTEHRIQLSDQYDQLIQKMGLNVAASSKMNDLKAPMPGLVLDVLVEEGQTFEKGEPLLILEAMKMENIIKATGEGTVKKISVSKSDAVDKGQVLLELA